MQLSFVQFSLCYELCSLSKTECKGIYHHFRCDHESSSFRKLSGSKWICRETSDFFFCNIKLLYCEKKDGWKASEDLRRILKMKAILPCSYHEEVIILAPTTFFSYKVLKSDSWKGITNLYLSENVGHHMPQQKVLFQFFLRTDSHICILILVCWF